MLPFTRYPTLRNYLKAVRDVVFQQGPRTATPPRITLVMGNPSADLDSFISAIVFSYFYNHASHAGDNVYIPLLNMPKTPSTDLWRLRPEFGVALRSAVSQPDTTSPEDQEKDLLAQTLTIKDLLDSPTTLPTLNQLFHPTSTPISQPIVLVDHNAPSITIPRTPTSAITTQLLLTGCIDHHLDENTIPTTAIPRIITTGIGSCTTLIMHHLRTSPLYPRSSLPTSETTALHQLLRLALAPILIDTHNLTASPPKCADLDITTAQSLELELGGSASLYGVKSSWDRDTFYRPIVKAKDGSLERLSVREMLGRDYKSWVEWGWECGIASLVRDVTWLVGRTGGVGGLCEEMKGWQGMVERERAEGDEGRVGFEVLVLLTPGEKGKGKEIVMVVFGERAEGVLGEFERRGREELGLREWDGDDDVLRGLREGLGEERVRVWWMTKREMTRKQGAPIVRAALRAVQEGAGGEAE